jgi:hypothetical protein
VISSKNLLDEVKPNLGPQIQVMMISTPHHSSQVQLTQTDHFAFSGSRICTGKTFQTDGYTTGI